MKKLLIFMGVVVMVSLMSCGNEAEKLKIANDSILGINSEQAALLDDLTSTLVDVSESLDSIALGEGFIKRGMGDGKSISKQEIMENISTFKQMLADNRTKLAELEKQLQGRNDKIGKLSALISHLQTELSEREETIARMEEIINRQNADISDLESQLEVANMAISDMEEENVQQREQLAEQDASLNTVYYTIGSSSQLKDRGLLSSGFLKKSRLDFSQIDKNTFIQSDKRSFLELKIPSKTAKILSGQPSDSYSLEEIDKNNCLLKITNPTRFWSVNNFLIIQTR